jgi:hypothetical protein
VRKDRVIATRENGMTNAEGYVLSPPTLHMFTPPASCRHLSTFVVVFFVASISAFARILQK